MYISSLLFLTLLSFASGTRASPQSSGSSGLIKVRTKTWFEFKDRLAPLQTLQPESSIDSCISGFSTRLSLVRLISWDAGKKECRSNGGTQNVAAGGGNVTIHFVVNGAVKTSVSALFSVTSKPVDSLTYSKFVNDLEARNTFLKKCDVAQEVAKERVDCIKYETNRGSSVLFQLSDVKKIG